MSPDQRREAIIAATIPLVRKHGFDVSTRQIAEAAGIAEGTIFRVFEDKKTLLREAVQAALDPSETDEKLAALDPAMPLADRLRAATELLASRMANTLELVAAIGIANLPADDRHQERYEKLIELLAKVFEPDRDELRCEPAEAARLLHIVAIGGSHPRMTGGRPLAPAEIVEFLLDGIRRRDLPAELASSSQRPQAGRSRPC